jgi:hypothetical protein
MSPPANVSATSVFEVAAPYLPYGLLVQTPDNLQVAVIGWQDGEFLFDSGVHLSYAFHQCTPVLHPFGWLCTMEGESTLRAILGTMAKGSAYAPAADTEYLTTSEQEEGIDGVYAYQQQAYWFNLTETGILHMGPGNRPGVLAYVGKQLLAAHVALGLQETQYVPY